jgi:hypothetical protein
LNDAPHTLLKLFVGIIVGVIGVAMLFRTDTNIGSLSILVLGFSSLFGLVSGIADHIEPLRRGFEWGQWLIAGIAVLFLLTTVQNYFTLTMLISAAIGLSGGVLVSTVGIVTSELVSKW